ncbi:hypothetical protein FQN49_007571, partial [Arthroderma sp. PD_2]
MTNQKDMGYGWFAKARFEANKASKERSPWAPGVWEASREDCRNGTLKKVTWPVLITTSGPFTSPVKVQEIVNLPSPPEVKSGSEATLECIREEPSEPREEDKVQYCEVEDTHFHMIKDRSHGESILIWFHGELRGAWLAYALKTEDKSEWDDLREACRNGVLRESLYPIIIADSGPFTSPQKVQEVLGLQASPEMRGTTRATFSEEQLADPREEDKVQYCEVDIDHLKMIEAYSEGEDVMIW